jgi:hypothetical protein
VPLRRLCLPSELVFNFHRPLFRSKYASFDRTNKRPLAFSL